jgi:catechol 2,3-dioxygenase-like lactoylglutathione lyase family enzyme
MITQSDGEVGVTFKILKGLRGGGGYHRGMARYHVEQIAIDGNDLDAMVEFWAAALGYEVGERDEGYAVLRDPDGAEPRVFLQKVPEAKAGKNRAHIDVAVPDEREAVDRLVGLGARVLWREVGPTYHWTVLADPDGNEFCVGDFG